MTETKIIEKILKVLNIKSHELDFIEKIISLEEDKRIASVELERSKMTTSSTDSLFKISVSVYETKWFENRQAFVDYIKEHSIAAFIEFDKKGLL